MPRIVPHRTMQHQQENNEREQCNEQPSADINYQHRPPVVAGRKSNVHVLDPHLVIAIGAITWFLVSVFFYHIIRIFNNYQPEYEELLQMFDAKLLGLEAAVKMLREQRKVLRISRNWMAIALGDDILDEQPID